MGSIAAWSPSLGDGQLDWHTGGGTFVYGGVTLAFKWSSVAMGRPGKEPKKKADRTEWEEWLTFVMRSGEVMLFRRGGKPLDLFA